MKVYRKSTVAALLLVFATGATATEFDIDGATAGKWTMDLDAAKSLAAEKKLPILLNFTGSDWCGWCKIMEENVFSKPEWREYAKDNLVMVFLDFPKDSALLPEKYMMRNNALRMQYGVQGFPTFVVLDHDGSTELGRLNAGRDKTPASFQKEIERLLRYRPAGVAKYTAGLDPKDAQTYRGIIDRLNGQKKALKEEEQKIADAREKIQQISTSINDLEEEARKFRVAQLNEEQREEYNKLKAQYDAAVWKLKEWISTQPERSEENVTKFNTMRDEIGAIIEKLDAY